MLCDCIQLTEGTLCEKCTMQKTLRCSIRMCAQGTWHCSYRGSHLFCSRFDPPPTQMLSHVCVCISQHTRPSHSRYTRRRRRRESRVSQCQSHSLDSALSALRGGLDIFLCQLKNQPPIPRGRYVFWIIQNTQKHGLTLTWTRDRPKLRKAARLRYHFADRAPHIQST